MSVYIDWPLECLITQLLYLSQYIHCILYTTSHKSQMTDMHLVTNGDREINTGRVHKLSSFNDVSTHRCVRHSRMARRESYDHLVRICFVELRWGTILPLSIVIFPLLLCADLPYLHKSCQQHFSYVLSNEATFHQFRMPPVYAPWNQSPRSDSYG